jgi:hypothetical protein
MQAWIPFIGIFFIVMNASKLSTCIYLCFIRFQEIQNLCHVNISVISSSETQFLSLYLLHSLHPFNIHPHTLLSHFHFVNGFNH